MLMELKRINVIPKLNYRLTIINCRYKRGAVRLAISFYAQFIRSCLTRILIFYGNTVDSDQMASGTGSTLFSIQFENTCKQTECCRFTG